MNEREKNNLIQENMKRLVESPPQHRFSEVRKKELVGRLYAIDEDKKKAIDFIPFKWPETIYAGAITAAIIVIGYIHFLTPLHPVVFRAKGNVQVYDSQSRSWKDLTEGARARLGKNDLVKTAENGMVDLAVKGVYHLRLEENSMIKLAQTRGRALAGDIQYDLSRGKVFAYYVPQKRYSIAGEENDLRKAFRIKTPEALLSVKGTGFMVEAKKALRRTWVGVLDGAVEVESTEAVIVEAGTKTVVQKGKAPAEPARLLKNELLQLEELYRIGEKEQVAVLISTGKTRVRELLSFTPLYISSDKESALSQELARIAALFNMAVEEGGKDEHLRTIKEFEDFITAYPNPKYDVQFLLFIGAYYEYLGEHHKAIGTFRRIISDYPKSKLASLAQCAIGIIYEEGLDSPEDARLAYSQVIANYPESPELHEATLGLNRL
jgi:TolA-binding protein